MERRLLVALGIAFLVGMTCYWYQITNNRAGGDIAWPLCAAQALLNGNDPYACSLGSHLPTNMLPTALLVIPITFLEPNFAASLMIAASTALLVWGLLRDGDYWRLLLLLAFPFWHCVQVANWTILLVAVAFLPWLYPLLIVKPHAAIPVAFNRFSLRGTMIGSSIVILAFVILPDWPMRWWMTAQSYSGNALVLQFPLAAVILLALVRWRAERARYLILCALAPWRAFYDYLLLFTIPQTPRQLLILICCSWLAYFCWFFWPITNMGVYIFGWLYLPCLIWVMRDTNQGALTADKGGSGDALTQFMRWYGSVTENQHAGSR